MGITQANKKSDSWLNSSRAKVRVKQPDRFYMNFTYEALYNQLYHMDIDCLLIEKKTLEFVAVIEAIKGLNREITSFKKQMYSKLARKLQVPFYIINWSRQDNKVIVTDCFANKRFEQTLIEHAKWLRSLGRPIMN